METHSREECREIMEAKGGRRTQSGDSSRRGTSRRLSNGDYCETDLHCSGGARCDVEGSWWNNGQEMTWGYCSTDCWAHDECDEGSYCSIQDGYTCRSCAAFATFDSVDGTNPCTRCSGHGDCAQGNYCSRSYYWDDNTYQSFEKQICSGCSGCWSWNTFDYGPCPDGAGEKCDVTLPSYGNTNWENDLEQNLLRASLRVLARRRARRVRRTVRRRLRRLWRRNRTLVRRLLRRRLLARLLRPESGRHRGFDHGLLLRLCRRPLLRRLDLQVLVLQEAQRADVASDGEPTATTRDGCGSHAIASGCSNASSRRQVGQNDGANG